MWMARKRQPKVMVLAVLRQWQHLDYLKVLLVGNMLYVSPWYVVEFFWGRKLSALAPTATMYVDVITLLEVSLWYK
jgi:hypothetical protein